MLHVELGPADALTAAPVPARSHMTAKDGRRVHDWIVEVHWTAWRTGSPFDAESDECRPHWEGKASSRHA